MPPRARNVNSCYNTTCASYTTTSKKAPLKCSGCRTAHYCDKTCQRSHWPVHKEFCKAWAEAAKLNGQTTVVEIKKKMLELIWLIRGLPWFTEPLLEMHQAFQRDSGRRGCIELRFSSYKELSEAIKVVQSLPVIGEVPFYPMPVAPTYTEDTHGRPLAQKLPIRVMLAESPKAAFDEAVFKKVAFLPVDGDKELQASRPNMITILGGPAGINKNMFMLCVTVKLQHPSSTHMFDWFYKRLSWFPEDTPELEFCRSGQIIYSRSRR